MIHTTRIVPLTRDPFRGAPIGESRESRKCVVMGVRMAARREVIEPTVFDLRLEIWKRARDDAAKRDDHAQVAFLTRCIARAEAKNGR